MRLVWQIWTELTIFLLEISVRKPEMTKYIRVASLGRLLALDIGAVLALELAAAEVGEEEGAELSGAHGSERNSIMRSFGGQWHAVCTTRGHETSGAVVLRCKRVKKSAARRIPGLQEYQS